MIGVVAVAWLRNQCNSEEKLYEYGVDEGGGSLRRFLHFRRPPREDPSVKGTPGHIFWHDRTLGALTPGASTLGYIKQQPIMAEEVVDSFWTINASPFCFRREV
ncbi:Uncharacterized protein FKW44_025074 [Caligus rogercresseyi]|uniref:Uncharacterized protein n=1 Tax=Caligus rogercresseyi TaxID=217165 RepID=A0A7T8GKV7_CALRO|nr:Uncharacterized protein FKW44_025074 [Caligus rogercresseyi]